MIKVDGRPDNYPLLLPLPAPAQGLTGLSHFRYGVSMRSRFVFVGFMLFVSVVYYLMAYGQTNSMLHVSAELAVVPQLVPGSSQPIDPARPSSNNVTTTSTTNSTANATTINNTPSQRPSVNASTTAAEVWGNVTSPDGYILNNPRLCAEGGGPVKVVVMVVSAPQHLSERQAIRHTWGTVARTTPHFRLAFALGRPAQDKVQMALRAESAQHGDLVQGNFLDAYYNLTLKSLMLLRWSRDFCPTAEYVLKIDDDCFLHPGNLLKFLAAPRKEKSERVIFGRVWQKVKPIRDKKDKWAVSKSQYAADTFPDYVGGPTYAVSRKAVPDLLEASRSVPMLDLEDVYVTGLCAEKAKVPRVSDAKFGMADTPAACQSRDVITYHRVAPSSQYMLWWFINEDRFENCAAKQKDACAADRTRMTFDLLNVITKNLPNP